MTRENRDLVNWEKISVYVSITVTALTILFYISDMKERIRALEVKVEKLEEKKQC